MAAFELVSAVASSYRQVDLTFTNPVEVNAIATSIGTYEISKGLLVIAVNVIAPNVVRLFTKNQVGGVAYTVSVSTALMDTTAQTLSLVTSLAFTGGVLAAPNVVVNLDARSYCTGKAIRLTWELPAGVAPTDVNSYKIIRRLRAWPFDLDEDAYDVALHLPGFVVKPLTSYLDTGLLDPLNFLTADAAPGDTVIHVSVANYNVGDTIRIENLEGVMGSDVATVTHVAPGGLDLTLSAPLTNTYKAGNPFADASFARIGIDSELLPQTYYYYLVLFDLVANPGQFDVADDSRAFALSIDVYDSHTWFREQAAKYDLQVDAKQIPNVPGSGGGFFDKWLQVMGCWLNLMRGHMNAFSMAGDPSNAPFNLLPAMNQSLGIDPEGEAYDFDTERRTLTSLVFVYKRKGTCPGIIETVRMFCKWDATCVELNQKGCAGGPGTLETWDGDSSIDTVEDTGLVVTQVVTAADGTSVFTDPSQAWDPDLWDGGRLRGWVGDIACVNTSTADALNMLPPTPVADLSAPAAIGDDVLQLTTTSLLEPGMSIQITSNVAVAGHFPAEIVTISATGMVPGAPGSIKLVAPIKNAYPLGSIISIGKSIVRAEWVGSIDATAAGQVITDPRASWVENQWVGFGILDSANQFHFVVSNTGNTVTVDGLAPVNGPYAVAVDFFAGVDFAHRTPILKYAVQNGIVSEINEPTFDLPEGGTINDPFTYLWMGPGAPLLGAWGTDDLGIYILDNIPKGSGAGSSAVTFTFNLDPSQPAPAINEWVGFFLNPNQNQTQLFEILANTATQLTVAGDVGGLVVPGQAYYVLTARDAVKYKRLVARLKKEFSHTDVNVHVLFV